MSTPEKEARDMSGTLSRNEDKAKPDAPAAWPDYKGRLRIDGRDYWLAGWVKDGRNGKFLSLAATPKDEAPRPAADSKAADPFGNLPF